MSQAFDRCFDQAAPVAVASRPGGASPPERGAGPGCGAQADARRRPRVRQEHAAGQVGGGGGRVEGVPSPGSPWTRGTTIGLAFSLTSSPRSSGSRGGGVRGGCSGRASLARAAAHRGTDDGPSQRDFCTAWRARPRAHDDYHLIDSESVHKIVSYLLERLPDGAHLVLSSRADPPLPLARLRARGQMAELGAADLAFTEEEADSFLKGVMDLDSSAEDVAKLEGRTEGWIAGLQLAALSMRGREDASGFVETFSGSNRDVLDFLAEEVLEIQPEAVRGFLLATSVLERLSAPLCDTLTGNNDGDEMLKRLERENVFVVALDDERRWYRYHHLFAEFLRGRLVHESPGLAGELHLRASAWYEDNGLISEAIGHGSPPPTTSGLRA